MIVHVGLYAATMGMAVILRKKMIASSLILYGEFKFALDQQQKAGARVYMGAGISLALSLACVIAVSLSPQFGIPPWLFALLCGGGCGLYLSAIFQNKYMQYGLYQNAIILHTEILEYPSIDRGEIEVDTEKGLALLSFFGNGGTKCNQKDRSVFPAEQITTLREILTTYHINLKLAPGEEPD